MKDDLFFNETAQCSIVISVHASEGATNKHSKKGQERHRKISRNMNMLPRQIGRALAQHQVIRIAGSSLPLHPWDLLPSPDVGNVV